MQDISTKLTNNTSIVRVLMGIWECTTLFTFLHAGTEASRTDSFREGTGREGVSRSPRLGIESPCDQQHVHDG